MFDKGRIEELRQDFDDEDFDEIIMLFLDEVEQRLTEITDCDCADISGTLHFLKGSAANLGFVSFNQACELAETTQSPHDIAAVARIYEESKQGFFELLHSEKMVA